MDAEVARPLDGEPGFLRKGVSRPRCGDQLRHAGDGSAFAPLQDGAYRIRARDKEQRHVSRIMFTKLAQRISRVGDARAIDLDAADIESGVALHRQAAHLEALFGGRDVALEFERRLSRGDEHHRIQIERLARLLGAGQMPDMAGIERAAHDAEAHWAAVGPKIVEALADHGRSRRLRTPGFGAGLRNAHPRRAPAPSRAARTCTRSGPRARRGRARAASAWRCRSRRPSRTCRHR